MAIEAVSVDNPVKASTMNQIISNVNVSNNRAIFTANGTWSVPVGVHRFKVTLCNIGAASTGLVTVGDGFQIDGPQGAHSPMASKIFSGIDEGTSYAITFTGDKTSFGADALYSRGGAVGWLHNGDIVLGNKTFMADAVLGFGEGGPAAKTQGGSITGGGPGGPGVCVIEW
jgi:hypothetical protein